MERSVKWEGLYRRNGIVWESKKSSWRVQSEMIMRKTTEYCLHSLLSWNVSIAHIESMLVMLTWFHNQHSWRKIAGFQDNWARQRTNREQYHDWRLDGWGKNDIEQSVDETHTVWTDFSLIFQEKLISEILIHLKLIISILSSPDSHVCIAIVEILPLSALSVHRAFTGPWISLHESTRPLFGWGWQLSSSRPNQCWFTFLRRDRVRPTASHSDLHSWISETWIFFRCLWWITKGRYWSRVSTTNPWGYRHLSWPSPVALSLPMLAVKWPKSGYRIEIHVDGAWGVPVRVWSRGCHDLANQSSVIFYCSLDHGLDWLDLLRAVQLTQKDWIHLPSA
jgi:hypothetical protein